MRGLRIHDADRRAGDSRRNGRAEGAVRTACELAHVWGGFRGRGNAQHAALKTGGTAILTPALL